MKAYEATATIDAPAEDVWAVLTDGNAMTTWDSGIERFEGAIGKDEKVKLWAAVSPGRPFSLKVVEFDPPRRMVWRGGMPLGLFTGVRTYTLQPEGGSTRFRVREEFSGPLLPLIWRSMPDLGPSFEQFATGLKTRVEQGSAKEQA